MGPENVTTRRGGSPTRARSGMGSLQMGSIGKPIRIVTNNPWP